MSIGSDRDRVVIQTPSYASSTQSGRGVASWSTLATIWAHVKVVSGGESISDGVVTSSVRYEVSARYRTDATPAMRLQWTPYLGTAKTLEILAVQPSPDIDRIVIVCEETA
jgi:SPP1 family predicted phage head-tail adaptor